MRTIKIAAAGDVSGSGVAVSVESVLCATLGSQGEQITPPHSAINAGAP